MLEVDASQAALGAVLSQRNSFSSPLHPVGFYSQTLNAAEINYPIGEKELLAIKCSLENWRHLLEGSTHPITIYTDHRNLQYLKTSKTLSARQVRWSFFFDRFDFQITYRPGSKNGKADALSRLAECRAAVTAPTCIIPPNKIILATIGLETQLKDALNIDCANIPPGLLKDQRGFLYKNNLLYIPTPLTTQVIRLCHDSPLAGHPGIAKTINLIRRNFWWPKMIKEIKQYVSTCETCAACKSDRNRPYGLLMSLPIPNRPWEWVSMDFIVELPRSRGNNTIMVVVDLLTKMAHFIALKKLPSSSETAEAFLSNVIKLHGIPSQVISDRGSQFVSKFWRALCLRLQIDHRMSTAYHPQTNGQTERVNQCLEQFLRCHCSFLQDDWESLLPLAEFAYNNSENSSTLHSPFFANYGFHPRSLPEISLPTNVPATDDYVTTLQTTLRMLKDNLQQAKERQKIYYDRHRRENPPYQVGDSVWLSTRNLRLGVPAKKLGRQFLGPFPIEKIINPNTVRLTLPPRLQVHPTFHVSLLKPFRPSPFPSRVPQPSPPIDVQGEEEFEVEQLLDSRRRRGRIQYLVRWKGYGSQDDSWEDVRDVHAPRLQRLFHRRFPDLPCPTGVPRRGSP